MVNTVDISKWLWPLSLFDNRRRVTAYGKSRGEVLHAADLYLQSLVEEVAEASGRSVDWGRFLFWSGHLLFWLGLLLSLVGLLTLDKAHLERLLWGPFGIGLLMQLPSGALVRAGRRILRPSAQELAAVDRRAPVLLLRSFRGGLRLEELAPSVRDALSQVGPLSLAVGATDGARFGEADWERVATLAIDQARLLVMMPGDPAAVESEIEAIAKRRHAHKLLVLLPPNSAVRDDNYDERPYCLTQLCSRGFSPSFFVKCRDAAPRPPERPLELISDLPSPSFRAQGRSRSAGTQVLRQTPPLPGRTLTAPSTVGRSWQLGML